MKTAFYLPVLLIFSALSFGQTSSGYLSLGEDSLYYETAGSGKNMVLIHDGLLHWDIWNHQFAFFAREFKVIRYDWRGYGRSSPATGSYTHLEDLTLLYE